MSQTPPDEPQRERSGPDPSPPSEPEPAGAHPGYPYAPGQEQPPAAPQPPPAYQAPAYQAPAYGADPYAADRYAAGGYTAPLQPPQPTPASTVVLLVVSGLATLSCWFTLAGIVPLVLSIVALTRQRTDPAATSRLTRIGWIVFAVAVVVVMLASAAFFVAAVVQAPAPNF